MNVFHGADGRYPEMTNGGTAVFVDVLALAVSTLAHEPWDFRFAALLTLQDQNVMGRGVVGFDLAELDWGDTPQEAAMASCVRHRVLDALPFLEACVFCTAGVWGPTYRSTPCDAPSKWSWSADHGAVIRRHELPDEPCE
ncbi:hypothetical protein OG413_14125 [Streptomyces sp. NBC_01433]|uniref:hypothetical protein n=1 Tax=Streptomyces sp. NBC_01433 TaxID=2903864 RepID=UPI0022519DD7|nr:hypothetical protein [Streptomyces sp. NBC_01433]MCX4676427.1 hypothetical protein [Streptomyces sp. NBC_01433]